MPEYPNHWGNVMAVISDKASATDEPTVVSLSDYYPYGMTEPGRSYSESDDYRFGYTGHEKESDLAEGVYTTEYRLLDTRLGRWLSVDPLFGKYPGMSSYNYCGGNPVMLVDLDGRKTGVKGEKEAVDGYVKMLHNHTGNNYAVENEQLVNKGKDTEYKGKTSEALAKKIDAGISSDKENTLNIVSNSDEIFIDSYSTKQVDVSDLQKMGEASAAFQAALIGHFVSEIQYENFDEGHKASLEFESEVYTEISGESVDPRFDYQESSLKEESGYVPIIFKFNDNNVYEIQQGASRKKVGEKEVFPGMKAPEYEQELNGDIESVKKR